MDINFVQHIIRKALNHVGPSASAIAAREGYLGTHLSMNKIIYEAERNEKIVRKAAPAFLEKMIPNMPWTRQKSPQMDYEPPLDPEPEGPTTDLGLSEQHVKDPAGIPNPLQLSEEDMTAPQDYTEQQVENAGNYLAEFLRDELLLDATFANALAQRVKDEVMQYVSQQTPAEQRTVPKIKRTPTKMPPQTQVQSQSSESEIDKLAAELAALADLVDQRGLTKEADQIDGILPKISLVKMAQYEGVQHYHLLNGRAFEKAWREKRKKKQSDDSRYHLDEKGWYRSAHDCWWETLEEYQDTLFGDHEDWLTKHASVESRVATAKDKKREEKEEKEEEEASGGISPGTTMSGPMTDEAKKRRDGKGVQEWLEDGGMPLPAYRRAFGILLLHKIGERIGAGSPPGVAFYEAMEYVSNGEMDRDIIRSASDVVSEIQLYAKDKKDKELEKAAQQWLGRGLNWMQDVGKGIGKAWEGAKALPGQAKALPGQAWQGAKDWAGKEMAAAKMYQQIEPYITNVEGLLGSVKQNPAGARVWLNAISRQTNALIDAIEKFIPAEQASLPETPAAEAQPAAQQAPGAQQMPVQTQMAPTPQGVSTLPFPA